MFKKKKQTLVSKALQSLGQQTESTGMKDCLRATEGSEMINT